MKKFIIKCLSKIFEILDNANQSYTYNCYRNLYNIDSTFIFNGENILFYGDGEITIGKDTYIGRYSILQCSKGSKISIGDNCKIGPRLSIWCNTSHVDSDFNYSGNIKPKVGNIIIGNGVWIGANVVISPGVKLGDNCIIGANSVVNKDVPDFAIVGGLPAKIIRFKKIETQN